MRPSRILTTLPVLAFCAVSFAQQQFVVGKVGETTASTGVYVSPNTHAKVYCWAPANEQWVIRHTSNSNWVEVLLKSHHWGFARASNFEELPYTVYGTKRSRSSLLASRGGSAVVRGSTGSYLADEALKFQGTPYEWGGNDLSNGVDCSGFVKELMGAIGGPNLPRTAHEQAFVGQAIHRYEDLRPGDRLYFKEPGDTKISHTAIYVGGWKFVHASHGKGKVTTDTLTNPGWRKILVAARR
jgi:cell wall-associated NlpC family hydrolase